MRGVRSRVSPRVGLTAIDADVRQDPAGGALLHQQLGKRLRAHAPVPRRVIQGIVEGLAGAVIDVLPVEEDGDALRPKTALE